MTTGELWGIMLVAWIAVPALPYAWFTVQSALVKNGGDGFTKYGIAWLPGFLVILVMSNSGAPPEYGVAWTLAYVFGLSAIVVLRRRRITSASAFYSRRFRAFVAGAALWITAVQAWGYVVDWSYDYSATQFAVINLTPPFLVILGYVAWHWIAAGRSEVVGRY